VLDLGRAWANFSAVVQRMIERRLRRERQRQADQE
jgi:hypothetical protein